MKKLKDSGVEWIGQIPAEWKRVKLKEVTNIIMGQSPEAQDIKDFGNIPFMQGNREFGSIYPNAVKFCDNSPKKSRIGDILLSVRAPVGAINVSDKVYAIGRGLCSICATSINSKFLMYFLMLIMQDTKKFGQGSTFDAITIQELKQLPVLLPPINTQNRIASYLDRKCAEIDAIIAKQQQVIEKLKEYKLSVITEAVTKGLDPNVPMKDSGVEWIGMVPERWKVGQLKYFATIRAGLTLGKKYEIDAKLVEMPYLCVANVQGEYVDLSDVSSVSVLPEEVEKYSLHKNELLMTEGGDKDKLGRGCVWNGEIDPCLHQNHVFAVATDAKKLSIHFLSYLTTSGVARSYFEYTAKKTTNLASTNSTIILQFKLPIPSIQEQGDIICYLDKCCKQINTLIHEKENILSKINEYKKALIYEVVTGKKEVL